MPWYMLAKHYTRRAILYMDPKGCKVSPLPSLFRGNKTFVYAGCCFLIVRHRADQPFADVLPQQLRAQKRLLVFCNDPNVKSNFYSVTGIFLYVNVCCLFCITVNIDDCSGLMDGASPWTDGTD